jgi:hypothetical protein
MPKPYWVDANVYIQAKNGPYGFEFAEPFWTWLEECCGSSIIRSPMTVYDELLEGNDELAEWAKEMKQHSLFVEADELAQAAVRQVVDFVTQTYKKSKYDKFLAGADPWVIAHAWYTEGTVVTHEKLVQPICRTPKIPNVCNQFGVECINVYDLIKTLGTLKFK